MCTLVYILLLITYTLVHIYTDNVYTISVDCDLCLENQTCSTTKTKCICNDDYRELEGSCVHLYYVSNVTNNVCSATSNPCNTQTEVCYIDSVGESACECKPGQYSVRIKKDGKNLFCTTG